MAEIKVGMLVEIVDDGGPALVKIGFDIRTVDDHIVIVSAVDYSRVQGMRWRIGANGYVYLVGARKKGVACLMHRIITSAISGQEIHHKDGNKLNNMRHNLEITTSKEHQVHHRHLLISRNISKRIYSDEGICKRCGEKFVKHPSHRGRQICCSKYCAIMLAAKRSKEVRNARH